MDENKEFTDEELKDTDTVCEISDDTKEEESSEKNEQVNIMEPEQEQPETFGIQDYSEVTYIPSGKTEKRLDNRMIVRSILVVFAVIFVISSVVGYINKPADVDLFGASGLIPAKDDGKWGYIDKKGAMIISPQFDYATEFRDGYAKITVNNKVGIIDDNGKIIVPAQYDDVMLFSDGMAGVLHNRKWGYVDKNGKLRVQLMYDDAREFSKGRAPVKSENKWGYIDKNGEQVGSFVYDDAYSFAKNGLALVNNGGRFGYVNTRSKIKIAAIYDIAESFNDDGYATVTLGSKMAVIDKSGDYIIPPEARSINYAGNDAFIVRNANGTYGVMDNEMDWIIEPEYNEIVSYIDGIALVRKGQLWGYVDSDDEITAFQYAVARPHSKMALAIVGDGSRVGIIDDDGDVKLPPMYDDIGDFITDISYARVGDNYGFIDDEGDFVIQPQYKEVSVFYDDGFAIVLDRNKRYTLINRKGESFGRSFEGILNYHKKCCMISGCFDECMFDSAYCYEHSGLLK